MKRSSQLQKLQASPDPAPRSELCSTPEIPRSNAAAHEERPDSKGKLETIRGIADAERGTRGPRRSARLNEFGVVAADWLRARLGVSIPALGTYLGVSVSQARNILAGRRAAPGGPDGLAQVLITMHQQRQDDPNNQYPLPPMFLEYPFLDLFPKKDQRPRDLGEEITVAKEANVVIDCVVLEARQSGFAKSVLTPILTNGSSCSELILDPLKLVISRSAMDAVPLHRRSSKFYRNLELQDFSAKRTNYALLSAGAPPRRCSQHRGKYAHDPTAKCLLPPSKCSYHRVCVVPPISAPSCPDCIFRDNLLRIDLKGSAQNSGLLLPLAQRCFLDLVDATTIELRELHVAFDLPVPADAVLASHRTLKREAVIGDGGTALTTYLGSPRSVISFCIYSKLHELAAKRDALERSSGLPSGCMGWPHVTRIEARIRVRDLVRRAQKAGRLGQDFTRDQLIDVILQDLHRSVSALRLADLRMLQPKWLTTPLLLFARPVGLRRATAEVQSGGASPGKTSGDSAGPRALDVACMGRTLEVLDELWPHIRLQHALASSTPRLGADLLAAMGSRGPSRPTVPLQPSSTPWL